MGLNNDISNVVDLTADDNSKRGQDDNLEAEDMLECNVETLSTAGVPALFAITANGNDALPMQVGGDITAAARVEPLPIKCEGTVCGGPHSKGAVARSASAETMTGKRSRAQDSSDDDSHDQCIICHEDFDNCGDHKVASMYHVKELFLFVSCPHPDGFGNCQIVSLSCGHLFGNSCILKWLSERKTCPSCNKKVHGHECIVA